jgi:hypothetical protein
MGERVERRSRGEGVAVMSTSYPDGLQGRKPVKICTFSGCVGTMRFHPRQKEAAGEHTLEWPWHATWVCQANPAHIEVATDAEEKALAGLGGADHD